MENKECGYTENMDLLLNDLKMYARFMGTLVRLHLLPIRNGQLLISNFGQKRFNQLRDGETPCP